MIKKTIQITLEVETDLPNIQVCDWVEETLIDRVVTLVSPSIIFLSVNETKVIEEKKIER